MTPTSRNRSTSAIIDASEHLQYVDVEFRFRRRPHRVPAVRGGHLVPDGLEPQLLAGGIHRKAAPDKVQAAGCHGGLPVLGPQRFPQRGLAGQPGNRGHEFREPPPQLFRGTADRFAGNFQAASASVDPLGQWSFATDPDLTGATHVLRDDAGRLRFWRANPDMSDTASQGFRYAKYTPSAASRKPACCSLSPS